VNNEFGRLWKETVVTEFEVLFRLFSGETDRNTNTSARISVSGPKFVPGTS
jgi:hypothetical protein